ncbi:metallophosphoesterase [Tardiphaga sp. vice154]|uniref:metallophosphoesterase family protein n=1 Tax=Tardiphaga sp. vice154 TaxID=2592814 RepID=UPI001161CE90|nr:metallophosphoesterase [Tardiphaga sp. vice154]QDM22737.1 metallophosphoesterase [Tardiphaga sp. vice154]
MTTFFTGDTHFGHKGILEFSARPFESIDEHNRALVDAWNSVVQPSDTVWHLGDFAHRIDARRKASIFGKLNGSKHLILGNHDDGDTTGLPWASVRQIAEISVESQRVVLCHYGLRVWPGISRGAIQLYGHSHGRLPGTALSLDVGVDCWNYCPVSLPMIKARLALSADVEPENDKGFTI